jgi:hypothetical protein
MPAPDVHTLLERIHALEITVSVRLAVIAVVSLASPYVGDVGSFFLTAVRAL